MGHAYCYGHSYYDTYAHHYCDYGGDDVITVALCALVLVQPKPTSVAPFAPEDSQSGRCVENRMAPPEKNLLTLVLVCHA